MGEQITGSIRERVHGITDTQGNKKPSYNTLKALFTPVRSIKIRKADNKILVTGVNHNGLPSYALSGYHVRLTSRQAGTVLQELLLPDVNPGNKFNLVFDDPGDGEYTLTFLSPEQREIAKYDFNLRQGN